MYYHTTYFHFMPLMKQNTFKWLHVSFLLIQVPYELVEIPSELHNIVAILMVISTVQDVEELGRKLGFTLDNGNFHNVSLGQGQEVVAEQAMDTAAGKGHWVVLQVILNSMCLSGTQVSLGVVMGDSQHCIGFRNGGAIGSITGDSKQFVWTRNGGAIG